MAIFLVSHIQRNDKTYFLPKIFKHKVWAVVIIDKNSNEKPNYSILINILSVLIYPFKFIPKHSVLRMKEYNLHTFRIGCVLNGFSVEFHIPKKFSFN